MTQHAPSVAISLVAQQGDLPVAAPTPASREFWDGCARHELLFQRCHACGGANFPPSPACRACLSLDLHWERSLGRGSLYSWTVVYRPQTDQFRVPYAPAIVDVGEGYQMLTNVINCRVDELRIGMPLDVVYMSPQQHIVLPYFQPAHAQE